jgi:hypothetical protein
VEHIYLVKYEKMIIVNDEGLEKYSDIWEFDVSLMKLDYIYF